MPAENENAPVGDDGIVWPVAQIVQAAGQVLPEWSREQAAAFVGYWLYALEHPSITNPVRWAIVQVKRGGRPAPLYLEMVAAGPSAVIAATPWGVPWIEQAARMKRNGLRDLLAPMIADAVPAAPPAALPVADEPQDEPDEPDEEEPPAPQPDETVNRVWANATLTPLQAWMYTQEQLQLEMEIGTYRRHVRNAELVHADETSNRMIIWAPTEIERRWLASRMTKPIQRHLNGMLMRPVQVEFVTGVDAAAGDLSAVV